MAATLKIAPRFRRWASAGYLKGGSAARRPEVDGYHLHAASGGELDPKRFAAIIDKVPRDR